MKFLAELILFIALNIAATGQTVNYEWQAITPGLVCNDSDISFCYVNDFLNDTAHNILWISGSFAGADTIQSPNLVGFDGKGYIKCPLANHNLKERDMIMYKNELAVASSAGLDIIDLDSSKLSGYATFYGGSGVRCMTVYNGDLIVGGNFNLIEYYDSIGIVQYMPATNIARWNGKDWDSLSTGIWGSSAAVMCLESFNGNLYAGGTFSNAGGINARNIAQWDGATWGTNGCSGTGAISLSPYVFDFEVLNGELYTAGYFDSICGNATYIAKTSGANWNQTSFDCLAIRQLTAFNSGLVVLTESCLPFTFFWDGGTKSVIDSAFNTSGINCVFNGELYAGGNFDYSGNTPIFRFARLKVDTSFGTGITSTVKNLGQLFPNPASTQLITTTYPASTEYIEVKNVLGNKMAYYRVTSGSTTIDVSGLPNGLYFLMVKSKEGMVVRKFVKE